MRKLFMKLKEKRIERLKRMVKPLILIEIEEENRYEIKLNLSLKNALELGRFIYEHKILSEFKDTAARAAKGDELTEIGVEFAEIALSKLLDLGEPIGKLLDKILGVENSIDVLQIGDIVDAFMKDEQMDKLKSFFSSAFKRGNQK